MVRRNQGEIFWHVLDQCEHEARYKIVEIESCREQSFSIARVSLSLDPQKQLFLEFEIVQASILIETANKPQFYVAPISNLISLKSQTQLDDLIFTISSRNRFAVLIPGREQKYTLVLQVPYSGLIEYMKLQWLHIEFKEEMPKVQSIQFFWEDRVMLLVWKNGTYGFLDLDAGGQLCSIQLFTSEDSLASRKSRFDSASPMKKILQKVRNSSKSRSKSPQNSFTKVIRAVMDSPGLIYQKKTINWFQNLKQGAHRSTKSLKQKFHYSAHFFKDVMILSNGFEV